MLSKRLKRIFCSFAAAGTLAGAFALPSRARANDGALLSRSYKVDNTCKHLPDLEAQHRRFTVPYSSEKYTKQQTLQAQNDLLVLGYDIGHGKADGILADKTRRALHEAQWFYGLKTSAQPDDATRTELGRRASQAKTDARKFGISSQMAATLRRSSERTGADMADLVKSGFADSQPLPSPGVWLALLKTAGPKAGFEGLADFIRLDQGRHEAYIDSFYPQLREAIFSLRENPRVLRLLLAAAATSGDETYKSFSQPPPASLSGYDPRIEQLQRNLGVIGFYLGPNGMDGHLGQTTQDALAEAIWFFGLPADTGYPSDTTIDSLQKIADVAVALGKKYNIPSAFAATVRRTADISGTPADYQLNMGAAESNFIITAANKESTAKGWGQFIDNTWLESIYADGDKAKLGGLSKLIHSENNRFGMPEYWVDGPPELEDAIMGFRYQIRVMGIMAALFTKQNEEKLECSLGVEIGNMGRYMAHFLGAEGAIYFYSHLKQTPGKAIRDLFPKAAKPNKCLFFVNCKGRARTLAEFGEVIRNKATRMRFNGFE